MTDLTVAPAPDDPAALACEPGPLFARERPQDGAIVHALVDAAFGPGRFAKVSERVREHARFRPDLSICAWSEGRLVGSVRQWTVRIGEDPCVFLGPIAVDSAERSKGLGAGLMRHAVAAAQAAGERLILLVGDMPLFAPLGFDIVPPGRVVMPGPVDLRRVLWLGLAPGALEGIEGTVRAPSTIESQPE
jgi:predicted N-acetyltransferase YhbS